MHLKLFTFFFVGLISIQTHAQEGFRMTNRDLLVGLSIRPLGNRGLGFHQFSRSSPELQTLYFLADHLALGANLRVSFSDNDFVKTSLADISIQARHWIGKRRRLTFLDARIGRGLITNQWKDPANGEQNQNNTMFAFGLGRAHPVVKEGRIYLEAELFYEFRKPKRGFWFDSFKFDVGVKYLWRSRGQSHKDL